MSSNNLFPVFLKLENLRLLMVGGGAIGAEKLGAVLANSPATNIKLVAEWFSDEVLEFALRYQNVTLVQKAYTATDMEDIDLVMVAVNDIPLAEIIRRDAREKRILINAADKPSLCDFYLGAVVQKGNLKIAISTNGKSPTVAKRLKEALSDMLPEEIESLLDNMQTIRNSLKTNFSEKVKQLNKITEGLVSDLPGSNKNSMDVDV